VSESVCKETRLLIFTEEGLGAVFTPVIPATWEAEIRIEVQEQPRQKVHEIPS
jgi:hypothetical protein